MIHKLSRQSTKVAPSPSQLCDLFDTGLSSSMPHAYLQPEEREVSCGAMGVCEAPRPRRVPSYLRYADHARFITLRTCSRRSYARAFDALIVAASGRGRPLTLSQGSGQSCAPGEGRR